MKKIINNVNSIKEDMLSGFVSAYGDIVKLEGSNLICRRIPKQEGKVGVVVGNGCGHEPCMTSLVGEGLLDVNVVGNIFAAPPPNQMLEGIKLADRGAGVLVLVSSHAGDIMNAKMAMMMCKVEGISAKMVVLYDDVSSAPKDQMKERRGTAGLFYCWKNASAAAEAGKTLDECVEVAEKTRDNVRTLSVAIDTGTHPETGERMFELPCDEIEVGMGVHGEAGTGRMKMTDAKTLVAVMLEQLIDDKPFVKGDEVAVLLNNSGSLTDMELCIIYKEICEYLEDRDIKIIRNWIGRYATTQEMSGFSISICKFDDSLLSYYDAPAKCVLKF